MHHAAPEAHRPNTTAVAAGNAALVDGDEPAAGSSRTPACDPALDAARGALHRDLKSLLPRLRGYALALTRDPLDADDLVQDCVARALVKLHLWQPGTDLRAWLFTILHNEHISRVRHDRMTRSRLEQSASLQSANCESAQLDHVALTELKRNMMRLTQGQRTAILMVTLTPHNYRQIAAACDVPVGTIRSRLARGRAILRKLGTAPPLPAAGSAVSNARRTASAMPSHPVANAAE